MGTPRPTCLLSGRAQDRLSKLQRELQLDMRSLCTHQSLLTGALQACDLSTQRVQLQDYLERVETVVAAATQLHMFASRYARETDQALPDESTVLRLKGESPQPSQSFQNATLIEE